MLYQIPGTSHFVDPTHVTQCFPNESPGYERVLCIACDGGTPRAIRIPESEPFTPARIANEIAMRANDPKRFEDAMAGD